MPKGVYKRTEEHKQKMSKSLKGKNKSPKTEEHKKKLSEAGKIAQNKPEVSLKKSIASKGRKISKKTRLKMSKSQKIAQNKPEAKLNMSKALKGRKFSIEHKRNLSLAGKGKHKKLLSEEQKENISVGVSKAIIEGKMKPNSNYKTGYFFSKINNKEMYYRSSYELETYKLLDDEDAQSIIKSWKTEPFTIPYKKDGITRNHVPDILVEYKSGKKQIINVKPEKRLNERDNILKHQAADKYAEENNMVHSIWTEKELGI